MNFTVKGTEEKHLKNGAQWNIVQYSVPKPKMFGMSKNKEQHKIYQDILRFANRKSQAMVNNPKLKKMRIQLSIEYEKRWSSTMFAEAGRELDFCDLYALEDTGKIKSFSLTFY